MAHHYRTGPPFSPSPSLFSGGVCVALVVVPEQSPRLLLAPSSCVSDSLGILSSLPRVGISRESPFNLLRSRRLRRRGSLRGATTRRYADHARELCNFVTYEYRRETRDNDRTTARTNERARARTHRTLTTSLPDTARRVSPSFLARPKLSGRSPLRFLRECGEGSALGGRGVTARPRAPLP